jgi:tripartite-type tricarboxylate transporter receptor subunit TctC
VTALETALKAAIEKPEVARKLEAAGTAPAWLSSSEVAAIWKERETAAKPIIDELLKEQQ